VIVPPDDDQGTNTIESDYEILLVLDTTKKIEIADKETKLSKINMACNTLSLNNVEEKSK
jgi:hypothetical protein